MPNPEALHRLEIRLAEESDIRHLVMLEKECFDAYYYSDYQFDDLDFRSYLESKGAILLVAIWNSSIIGYAAGSVRGAQSELVAELDSIAVTSTFRGKRVGDRLLRCFIKDAKNRSCKKILLQVATHNEGAMVFFSRRGFQKIRYLPGYYGKRWDGILMELKI